MPSRATPAAPRSPSSPSRAPTSSRGRRSRSTTTSRLNARPFFATDKTDSSSHIDGATSADRFGRTGCSSSAAGKASTSGRRSSSSSTCRRRRCAPVTSARPSTRRHRCRSSTTRHRQSGRHRTAAVPGERRSRGPHQPDRAANPGALSPAQPRRQPLERQRRRRGDLPQLPARAGPQVRSQQLRLQGQLERVAGNQVWGKYSRMGATVDLAPGYLGYDGSADRRHDGQISTRSATTWTMNPKTVFDATSGSRR